MVLLEYSQFRKCHYCARDVENRFWPCLDCNQSVYYGEKCAELDWKFTHRVECGLTGYWASQSKSTFHMFRLFNRIDVEEVLHTIEKQKCAPYDMLQYRQNEIQRLTKAVDKDKSLLSKKYRAQMSLLDHSDKYSIDYLAYNMLNAIECVLMACIVQGFGK